MRLHSVTLLVAFTLVACSCALLADAVSTSTIATSNISNSGIESVAQTTRRLMRQNSLDERMFSVPTLSGELAKKSSNPSQVSKLFDKLKLGEGNLKLFENPKFQKWASAVATKYSTKADDAEMLMAATLVSKYTEKGFADMIVAAKKLEITNTVATKLEAAQMRNWLSQGKDVDDVFRTFQLHLDMKNILSNPLLEFWGTYATMTKADPLQLLFSKLKSQNWYDDVQIAGMLGRANRDAISPSFTNKLESMVFDSWAPRTIDDIFTSLKLGNKGEQLFSTPAFGTWATYATKLDAEKADEAMLSVLRATYKDEAIVTKMFAAVKESHSTKTIVGKLEQAQYKAWRESGKSADDAFVLLKLDDEMDNLFSNPVLNNWVAYVEKLEQNPYTMLITKLMTSDVTNTNRKLTKLVNTQVKKTNTPFAKPYAEKLQEELWFRQGKQAGPVFDLLDIHPPDSLTNLFRTHGFSRWISYATRLDAKPLDEIVFSVLKDRYNVKVLERLIGTAYNVPSTMAIAPKLEIRLRNYQAKW